MIESVEAVVLRTLNHGDTSKIVTLYSREAGRLKMIAKGIRSPKNKSVGLFQPTHHIQAAYYTKAHSELQLFKSGELVQGFYHLESDLDRLTLAQVVVELVERASENDEPHEAVFALLVKTLERLNDKDSRASLTYWFFHLRFLTEMGFRPETDRCQLCGSSLREGALLRPREAGMTCQTCQPRESADIALPPELVQAVHRLSDDQWGELADLNFSPTIRRRLWDFLWRYTHYHLESTRNMRSLAVLNQLYG